MSRRAALVVGLLLIGAGVLLLAREFVPDFTWSLVWPWLSIGVGVLLVILSVRPARGD